MQRLITAGEAAGIDRDAALHGATTELLMENAGRAVADRVATTFGPAAGRRVLVLCGKGNNGGDGLVAARYLRERQATVACLLLTSPSELRADTRRNYARLLESGLTPIENPSPDRVAAAIADSDVVIDAIFGTGLASSPAGVIADIIRAVNRSGRPVVAVDVPSGIHSDTGTALEPAVRAVTTVTMGLAKAGLFLHPGRSAAGEVRVADIGFPPGLLTGGNTFLLERSDIHRMLPPRRADGHKGTFGTALLVGGSRGCSGAICLAAAAAARSGCGLVRVALPAGIATTVATRVLEPVKHHLPETDAGSIAGSALDELCSLAGDSDAVAVGPGLSTRPETRDVLLDLLRGIRRPVVVDADGLNCLAGCVDVLGKIGAPAILTPHPGEFARLSNVAVETLASDRIGHARRFAMAHAVTLVLKGAPTVVATPDGTAYLNPTGNSGLATGGTGDVLTGLLAGLLAQGMTAADAACSAVFLHGLAADFGAAELTEYCLTAGDLLDYLPAAFKSVMKATSA